MAVATAVETTTASVGKVAAAAVVMATVAMKAKAARGGMDDEGGKGNDFYENKSLLKRGRGGGINSALKLNKFF